MASTINQTNKVLLRAKRIHICGIHLGLLPQTSPGGCHFYHHLNLLYFGEALAPM